MSPVSSLLRRAAGDVRQQPTRKAPAPPDQRTSSTGRPRARIPCTPRSGLRRLLLVVLHVLEIGIDHVVAAAALLRTCVAGAGLAAVDGLAQLQRRLRERA